MSKKQLVFAFLLSFQSIFAQNALIKGQVSDSKTGEPLIGATVQVKEIGTITDLDGNYELNLPAGQHYIEFRYLSYETVVQNIRLQAGQSQELNQGLQPEATILETATVTSGKHEKALSEVTVSLEVLKPSLIASTGKLSLDDALEKIPGITIIDGQANIRGGSGYSQGAGSRVLLMVDDVPILQADAGFPNWDDIPIENIAQVEVLKGAASALYGSSAMNGIINVRTAYPTAKPTTEGAVYYTHFFSPADSSFKWWEGEAAPFTVGAQLTHRRKINKLDLVLGGYYVNEQSYEQDVTKEYGRFNFNTLYRITDRFSVGLNGNFNQGTSSSFFYWVDAATPYIGNPTTLSNRKRLRYNIDPHITIYDKANNKHRILGRFYNVDNDNDNNQSNFSDLYYGEYQFQRQFKDIDLVLTTGVVATFSQVEAELYGDTTFSSRNLAAYLQLDHKLFEKLNLSGGFRYENNLLQNPGFVYEKGTVLPSDERESKPVLRLGMNYELASFTFLRASWGQGYRFPTVAEKFIVTNAGFFDVLPNPELRSETGWTGEIGIKQGFGVGSFKGFFDFAAFISRYQDMIEFNLVGGDFRATNIGDTEMQGIDISIAGKGELLGLPTTLLAGYTYVDPRFKEFEDTPIVAGETGTQGQINAQNSSSDDNILKYRSRHIVKLDIETNIKGGFVGVESFYNSHLEAIDAAFILIIKGLSQFREGNNKGYTVLNFRAGYRFSDSVKMSLLLNNAANTIYSARPGLMAAPRNLTARVDFKF